MIKIGACDDCQVILTVLSDFIKEYIEKMKIKAELKLYDSGEELLQEEEKPELLFLDIKMPGMDGIEVGRQLRNQGVDCKIIIITGSTEQFKEAFKINTFRYLTKPLKKEEIVEVLDDVFHTGMGMELIDIYCKRNRYTYHQRNIIYMVAMNSAVEFTLKTGIFRKETSLSKMEKVLDSRLFYRISKQYIINMGEIEDYKDGSILIHNMKLKVSVRRKKEFEKVYTMFKKYK